MMEHDPLVELIDDPIRDTVHQPYSAFNQGYKARELGYGEGLNPYHVGTSERAWWEKGWMEAHVHLKPIRDTHDPFVCDVCGSFYVSPGELSNRSTGEKLVCMDCAFGDCSEED